MKEYKFIKGVGLLNLNQKINEAAADGFIIEDWKMVRGSSYNSCHKTVLMSKDIETEKEEVKSSNFPLPQD